MPPDFRAIFAGVEASSTKVFHSLQFGHFPVQRGDMYPHD
jgi:hypothetical protein